MVIMIDVVTRQHTGAAASAARLHLVDLAGSERVDKSEVRGEKSGKGKRNKKRSRLTRVHRSPGEPSRKRSTLTDRSRPSGM